MDGRRNEGEQDHRTFSAPEKRQKKLKQKDSLSDMSLEQADHMSLFIRIFLIFHHFFNISLFFPYFSWIFIFNFNKISRISINKISDFFKKFYSELFWVIFNVFWHQKWPKNEKSMTVLMFFRLKKIFFDKTLFFPYFSKKILIFSLFFGKFSLFC